MHLQYVPLWLRYCISPLQMFDYLAIIFITTGRYASAVYAMAHGPFLHARLAAGDKISTDVACRALPLR